MQTSKIKSSSKPGPFWQSLLIAIILAAPSVVHAEEAELWLGKMYEAVHTLNYSGTYVHINQDQIETMQIVHGVDENGERERLLSLNGEAREILRDSEKVVCILPADRSVIVGKHKAGSGLPALVPDNIAQLKPLYHIELIGKDRIAGYSTVILSVHPKDKMRYGYRIWLEEESGMVLRSDILENNGKVMQQMMFTDISLQSPVSLAMLEATVPHDKFRIIKDDSGHGAGQDVAESHWSFAGMPKGFKVTSKTKKHMPMNKDEVEHIVLSDGLASISVYIERSVGKGQSLDGPSKMGGINVFGRKIGEHRITVMGEVPKETVREVANSVLYQ